jgi:Ca2+-binding RTX toxin-like protein
MNPPDQANPGVGVFNTANMDLNNLFRGSFDYFVIQHEAGHALGMAHPHDTGGGSVIMEGVSSAFDDYGLFNLNQAVFTMMSYNVGYDSVFPNVGDFGATVGPMAFDIALLQQKYGAPATALNNGNTVYDMPNANGTGTYFRCIWDDGGKDTIRYSGATDAIISLVAATLDYSPTGGGVVSYAAGIQGGFTIAHGVVIEHARGGRGNDDISGNAANNKLWGAAGRDSMVGDGGIDSLYGGNGNDQLSGGDGSDRLYGQNGADRLDGGGGNDRLFGGNGNDTLIGGAGLDDFIIKDNFGRDTIVDFNSANGNEDIDLSGVSSITSYNDLVNNHMTQVGLDAIINAGGGNILTILNTAIIALGIDDFIF